MKLKFIFSLMLVLGMIGVNAQSIRSFEAMGYEDAAIKGINGSLTYYLKIKPDDDVNKSKLILNISASQVLNPNTSFIVISVKDLPVFTQRIAVSPTDTMFRIEIPLNQTEVQPDGRYIKMKISASMSIHEEQCKDIDNIACWIGIKNSSYDQGAGRQHRGFVDLVHGHAVVQIAHGFRHDGVGLDVGTQARLQRQRCAGASTRRRRTL